MKLITPSKILYLGIDAPPGVEVQHYPVIRTQRIDSQKLQDALSQLHRFTHVIFTSKNGVRHWHEVGNVKGKVAIAIGEATARQLRQNGVEPLVATSATQEGVIALIETLPLENSYLLYPRSKSARPHLADYFKKRNVPVFILDLYETIFQRIEPVPDLGQFDEIVFTSPSTVEGFLRIFGALPRDKKLIAIGPITEKAIVLKKNH